MTHILQISIIKILDHYRFGIRITNLRGGPHKAT